MTPRLAFALIVVAVLVTLALVVADIPTHDPEPVRVHTSGWVQAPTVESWVAPTTSTSVAALAKQETAPLKRPTVHAATFHAESVGGSLNGHPCGGDLPPCWVMMRESGGNPRAVNPHGCGGRGCYGKWQYDPNTWRNYDGYGNAAEAPESVQDDKARQDWAGGVGCHHWSACG